jgi:hypothetical protein
MSHGDPATPTDNHKIIVHHNGCIKPAQKKHDRRPTQQREEDFGFDSKPGRRNMQGLH